jgi:hypothetical protein
VATRASSPAAAVWAKDFTDDAETDVRALVDAENSATDVDRARTATRELHALSGELNRLVGVFRV